MEPVELSIILSKDPKVVELTENIRVTFETSQEFGVGAFCFFRQEQKDLGQMVGNFEPKNNGAVSYEFIPISLYEFQEHLKQPPFDNSKSVNETLNALKKANTVEELGGYKRLAVIQGQLVELLNYIESQEGFTLSPDQRKKAKQH